MPPLPFCSSVFTHLTSGAFSLRETESSWLVFLVHSPQSCSNLHNHHGEWNVSAFVIVSCEVKLTITAQWMLSIAAAMIIIYMNLCQCRKGAAKTEKPGLTSVSFIVLSLSLSVSLTLCLSLSLPSVSISAVSLSLSLLSLIHI